VAKNRRDEELRNAGLTPQFTIGLLKARMRLLQSSPLLAFTAIVVALIIMGWLIYLNHAS